MSVQVFITHNILQQSREMDNAQNARDAQELKYVFLLERRTVVHTVVMTPATCKEPGVEGWSRSPYLSKPLVT